jgi:hypothetical protein
MEESDTLSKGKRVMIWLSFGGIFFKIPGVGYDLAKEGRGFGVFRTSSFPR